MKTPVFSSLFFLSTDGVKTVPVPSRMGKPEVKTFSSRCHLRLVTSEFGHKHFHPVITKYLYGIGSNFLRGKEDCVKTFLEIVDSCKRK